MSAAKSKDAEAAAKAALAKKREAEAAAEQAKLEEYRRDVPPGIEVTDAAERELAANRPPVHLYAALRKAQAGFETVRKNGQNPHFKSKYATLDEIWETVRKPISEAGLVVFCTIHTVDGVKELTTHVAETASGEEISCSFPLPQAANTPQAIGSAMTYARRYTLTALLEIVTGDGLDDDGEAAARPTGKGSQAATNDLGF